MAIKWRKNKKNLSGTILNEELGFVALESSCRREISSIIVIDDYLRFKEPKSPYNFFLLF